MATRYSAYNWVALGDTYRQALEEGRMDAYRKRRWQRSEEFSTWLTESALLLLSEKQGCGPVPGLRFEPGEGIQDESYRGNPGFSGFPTVR